MPPLIKRILDDAASVMIDDINGPGTKVGPDEKVIATIPNNLRGLWEVQRVYAAKHDELCEKMRSPSFGDLSEGECRRITRDHDEANILYHVASEMFHASVAHLIMDHKDARTLALRENWQVIRSAANPIDDLLANLIAVLAEKHAKPPQGDPKAS